MWGSVFCSWGLAQREVLCEAQPYKRIRAICDEEEDIIKGNLMFDLEGEDIFGNYMT
jgi:hypothetical protein